MGATRWRRHVSCKLRRWRRYLGQPTVAHRALFSVFRWAWRVRHPKGPDRPIDHIVRELQDHRSLEWWEGEKLLLAATDPAQRHEVWRHRKVGRQRSPWELPLYVALGPSWRTVAETSNAADWKRTTLEAVKILSTLWALPEVPDKPVKPVKPAVKSRRPRGRPKKNNTGAVSGAKRAELPTPEAWATYLQEENWLKPAGCLKHVIDAEVVAGWTNGHTKFLETGCLDDTAQRALELTAAMARTWKCDHRGLACEWRKRERNLEADWACNAALDAQTGFCWLKQAPDPGQANVIIYSDGGLRERAAAAPGRHVAAYGWAIRQFAGTGTQLLAMGAELVEGETTVPFLELMGLWAAKFNFQRFAEGYTPEPKLRELIIVNNMLINYLSAIGETR